MKKLSLLIALALIVTIGGVYATWIYTGDDVADITDSKAIKLTNATFKDTYGTYTSNVDNLIITVDPKQNHTNNHTTSLIIEGYIEITFTPDENAPGDVKTGGVNTVYWFSVSKDNWTFNDGSGTKDIITFAHTGEEAKHQITWTYDSARGVCYARIEADEIARHFNLTEFYLDTKTDYDAFDAALQQAQLVLHISDGKTSSTNTTSH